MSTKDPPYKSPLLKIPLQKKRKQKQTSWRKLKKKIQDTIISNNKSAKNKPGCASWWKTTNYTLGKRKRCSTALDSDVEEMNQFFADVWRDEDYQPPRKTEIGGTPPVEVSPHLVYGVLRKTGDTVRGKDGMPVRVFHENAHNLTFPPKHTFDHCLAQGKYHVRLNITKVIPLPTVATFRSLNDLRPIAINPMMSWIMGKILLKSFVATNYEEEIEARQHGFRVGRSKENAPTRLQSDCRLFQWAGFNYVRIISLVFSKAFDEVKHNLLVEKFYGCHLDYHVINLIADSFTDRNQYVTVNKFVSKMLSLDLGVIQGTVSGPRFFNYYIKDLLTDTESTRHSNFADDATIATAGYFDAGDESYQSLCPVIEWFQIYKLSLNTSKSR